MIMEDMMTTFSDRLKMLRLSHDMTQNDLAKRISVNKQTISQYERGVRRPDLDTLGRLCDVFNVSSDYMLGETDVTVRLVDTEEMLALDAKRKTVSIPVYGAVKAGFPNIAMQEVIDIEEVSPEMIKDGAEYFGLKLRGDSMEPRMMDGDVVIVRQQPDVESGQIAIVMVNSEDATCKRVRKYRDGIELVANNPVYEPKFYSNKEIDELPVRVLGRVVELRGKF